MKKLSLIVSILVFCFPALLFATHVAVLETISAKDALSLEEKQYLTDVLRSEAVKALPASKGFVIMTRENIQMMLPPGKAIEDCEGSCLVETGKNISADYVAQGRIGRFGSNLTITVELYETAGNKLIGSFAAKSPDVEQLEVEIRGKAQALFLMVSEKQLENELSKEAMFPAAPQVEPEAEPKAEVPVEPEEKAKWIWGGAIIGAFYSDFYDSQFGLANIQFNKNYSVKATGGDDLSGSYWGVGFDLGVGGLFLFNPYFGVRADVGASFVSGSGKSDVTVKLSDENKMSKSTDMEIEYSVQQFNVDIPVALRLMMPSLVYVEAGPMVSFNLYSKHKSTITDEFGTEDYEADGGLKAFEFDVVAGIGVMRRIGSSFLDFNLRFVLGLTPLCDTPDSPKTWQGRFNIAYWFI